MKRAGIAKRLGLVVASVTCLFGTTSALLAQSKKPIEFLHFSGAIEGKTVSVAIALVKLAPPGSIITLDSDGGSVQLGLEFATEVHKRGMATLIKEGDRCYSACSYVFFAGKDRRVDGELGVHQISYDQQDNTATQEIVSSIIEALNQFDVPPPVFAIMFRTRANAIHIFDADEIAKFGINRGVVPFPEPDCVPMLGSKRGFTAMIASGTPFCKNQKPPTKWKRVTP